MSIQPNTNENKLIGTEQTLVQHLLELRTRLLHSVYCLVIVLVVLMSYPGPDRIYNFLAKPLVAALPKGAHMISIGVISPFLVPVKVTVLLSVMVSIPWILYQIWRFIAPGLYKHEKRLIAPLIFSSTILFYAGVAFSYFIVFNQAFPEIMRMAPSSVVVSPDIETYLDFVITMFLCFGLAFEVPIIIVILVRMEFVSIEKLKSFRSYYIAAAAAVSALVTPPDPVSMLALLIPLILLFEVGLIVSKFFVRYTKPPKKTSIEIDKIP
jgi:sec-independent protein translocase protein TatC